MATPRSSLNPITAAFTAIGVGTVLTLLVGVLVGLVSGEMARSVGSVGMWGMAITAIAAAGAAAVASMGSESSEDAAG